jgi:HPt (histidine-containing phosphotransfer) domain-containing protein
MDSEFERKLRELRALYAAELPGKIQEISSLWDAILNGKDEPIALQTLQRQVHRLAGTGKAFGFSAVTDIARKLECALDPLVGNNVIMNADLGSGIGALLEALNQAISNPDPDGQ